MEHILYLHGLDSYPNSNKVSALTQNYLVHAPHINYRDDGVWNYLEGIFYEMQPDQIIGSSMGGYFAMLLELNNLNGDIPTKLTLINPAIHSRSFEPQIPDRVRILDSFERWRLPGLLVLGKDDDVIDHQKTRDMFIEHQGLLSMDCVIYDGGHRITNEQFVDVLSSNGYLIK